MTGVFFREQSFHKLPRKLRKATIKSRPELDGDWGHPRKFEETYYSATGL